LWMVDGLEDLVGTHLLDCWLAYYIVTKCCL
jgi:hypothetical protein